MKIDQLHLNTRTIRIFSATTTPTRPGLYSGKKYNHKYQMLKHWINQKNATYANPKLTYEKGKRFFKKRPQRQTVDLNQSHQEEPQ